ncbi:hypothetical protein [Halocatena halophila]|uniref:hypothetical protein n=1 Tax=Halocatena halophila TaxID=2814576 RepID=UPI002ED15A98
MSADKRILVAAETLHDIMELGEPYNNLLTELAQLRRRQELAARFEKMDESRAEFVPLDDG